MVFQDRADAGRRLSASLQRYRGESPLVLGLPRGGVVVAYEVALALNAPLDIWVVRKVGVPGQEELGLGAVAEGGEIYLDAASARVVGLDRNEVAALVAQKTAEVEARARRFRGGLPPPEIRDRTVIVVDDGIATGGTVRAALRALRSRSPARLVLAAPIAAADTLRSLRGEADDIVCLDADPYLSSIGRYYIDFRQTSDETVVDLLQRAGGGQRDDR